MKKVINASIKSIKTIVYTVEQICEHTDFLVNVLNAITGFLVSGAGIAAYGLGICEMAMGGTAKKEGDENWAKTLILGTFTAIGGLLTLWIGYTGYLVAANDGVRDIENYFYEKRHPKAVENDEDEEDEPEEEKRNISNEDPDGIKLFD